MEEKINNKETKQIQEDLKKELINHENEFIKSEIQYLIIKALVIIIPILIGIFLDKILDLF